MPGGSLLVGRWTFRQGKFKASVSMTSSSEASLTSVSTSTVSTAAPRETAPVRGHHEDPDTWLWMKDTKSRIEHPIAHVDEHDKRPPVKALILKHRHEIDQLRARLEGDPLFNPRKHDDLWVMRFLFSHRFHQDNAFNAAQSTLAFREEHNLDHWDIRHIEVQAHALLEADYPFAHAASKMYECYDTEDTMIYYIPNTQRGVVGFLHLATRNQHRMAAELNDQDSFEAHLFSTEWKFQWLDYLTRSTGLLTKYLSIADCQGVNRGMMNKESKRQDGAAAKIMEDKYPQLLGTMVVVNAPIWVNVVFAVIKPFVPKRLLEKINVLKPLKKERDLLALQEYVGLEDLPTKYGGRLQEWPPPYQNSCFFS